MPRWRARAQINDHVENAAFQATHQLGLFEGGGLIMQASERAPFCVECDAALHDLEFNVMCGKFLPAVCAGKKTTPDWVEFRFDDKSPSKRSCREDHSAYLSSGNRDDELPSP